MGFWEVSRLHLVVGRRAGFEELQLCDLQARHRLDMPEAEGKSIGKAGTRGKRSNFIIHLLNSSNT